MCQKCVGVNPDWDALLTEAEKAFIVAPDFRCSVDLRRLPKEEVKTIVNLIMVIFEERTSARKKPARKSKRKVIGLRLRKNG